MHECEFAIFLLKEERYEKNMFYYKGFGPGEDTSIPPVPVLNSTLATLSKATHALKAAFPQNKPPSPPLPYPFAFK